MELREKYNQLQNEINNEFQRLVDLRSYDILSHTIKEFYDTVSENVLDMVKTHGVKEAILNYDILDCSDEIYYSDRNCNERLCHLLGVDEESRLFVFDNEINDIKYISFHDINNNLDKIVVIELMKGYLTSL